MEALKAGLALVARVLRDGRWQQLPARALVPGDAIRIRAGDIIPADVKLVDGDYLSVDQSALTGESLPVNKEPGDTAYSGSVAKQGEVVALVTGTGPNTKFARTAKLVEQAGAVSHFQKAVLTIGNYLIYVSLGLAAVLVLTQNKLSMGAPTLFEAVDEQELILAAALASKAENRDAIDEAMIGGLENADVLDTFRPVRFVPFDPKSKRTEGTVEDKERRTTKASKGAPQVIFSLCALNEPKLSQAQKHVDEFASKGYRTLGVAKADSDGTWKFLGIIPLSDPPRKDSANMIKRAAEHGIDVKMVTGDNLAIAKEIARQLEMKANILRADEAFSDGEKDETLGADLVEKIEQAEGFAQVYPEHKFHIVKALQKRGHLVAMTGDGVNDAPALKQADVGIAVSGATNAAQAAASLVLTAPGLSVIIKAVEEARRIFERMNSYATYRITETIRIMFFIVLAMLVFNLYPITTVMIILLALLNDLPILTIAYDNTRLDPKPVRWNMHRVLTVSTILGLVGVIQSFGLLLLGKMWLDLDAPHLQSLIYLKLAVAGHLTLFVVRTQGWFFKRPYPAPLLMIAVIGTQIMAAMIVGFGFIVASIPWSYVGLVWVYCLARLFINDWIKVHVYRHLDLRGKRHQSFLEHAQQPLHPHSSQTARGT